MSLTFDHSTLGQRVLFGHGKAVDHTVTALEGLGAGRVLLIASPSAMATADRIASRAPVVERIHEIVQHVPAANAQAAVRSARSRHIDAVVSLGGGSATGLAKIVARETGLPIVALPTTFAGSEATDVWGLTDGGRKITGSDPAVLPKVVVYDAALSAGLPAGLAAASGMNALAHAIDALWAPRADPINTALGTEAMGALISGLTRLARDGADFEAREKALYGAYLSAVAFASAGSGLHHKICHALGGTYDLPHAQTHSVVIRYVAAFNSPAAPDAAARLSAALGGRQPGPGLVALAAELDAPSSLAALGLREEDIAPAAAIILPTVPASNPRPVSQTDLEALLHAAWAGDPLS
jgi:maleylacetate reductase